MGQAEIYAILKENKNRELHYLDLSEITGIQPKTACKLANKLNRAFEEIKKTKEGTFKYDKQY